MIVYLVILRIIYRRVQKAVKDHVILDNLKIISNKNALPATQLALNVLDQLLMIVLIALEYL